MNKCCISCKHKKYTTPTTIVIQGPMGPTGPTGLSGENVEVGETFTINPNEQARVVSSKRDDRLVLDFYIPKGDYGVAEPIKAGITQSVESYEPAEITDRFENEIRYFDFKIPKGVQGPPGPQGDPGQKGDKGEQGDAGPKGETGPQGPRGLPGEIGISEVITIDKTETIGSDEPAEVQDDFDRNIHHLTFYIPKGVTGAQGPQGVPGTKGDKGEQGDIGPQGVKGETGIAGPAGPPGLTPDVNATIYNSNSQNISNGNLLEINEILTNRGIKIENNTIIVSTPGTYLISFSINNATSPTGGDSVGISINGTMIECSKRPLTASTNTSATIVYRLQKNDAVGLSAQLLGNRTLLASGAPSAMLTVMLIAN